MSELETNSPDELRDLYRDLILDHAKNPRHFGKLQDATHYADGINPLCGDKLRLYLRIDSSDSITAASFEGSGCAISVASASLLTETIAGSNVSSAKAYFRTVTNRLTGSQSRPVDSSDIDIGKIRALDGVREFPARVKCATLAWHALSAAMQQHSTPASTE